VRHGTYLQEPAVKTKGSLSQKPPQIVSLGDYPRRSADASHSASSMLYASIQEAKGQVSSSIYMSTPDRYSVASRGSDTVSKSSSYSESLQPGSALTGSQVNSQARARPGGQISELPHPNGFFDDGAQPSGNDPRRSADASHSASSMLYASIQEAKGQVSSSIYMSTPDRYSVASRGSDTVSKSSSYSESLQPGSALTGSQVTLHLHSLSLSSNRRVQDIRHLTHSLPSYFPLLEQCILEIDSLAWDLHGSLNSWLMQSAHWEDSELSFFYCQYSNKESMLRQKVRSAEVLTTARLGWDKARVLRQKFEDIHFLVSNFRSKTNTSELNSLLIQVQECERSILKQFSLLENKSSEVHPKIFNSASKIVDDSRESTLTRHTNESLKKKKPIAISSPSKTNERAIHAALDSQSRVTTSKLIQVSLERSVSGFGITLAQYGHDVIVSAIATGSPSHR
jgi:hypothetical protein